MRTMSDTLPTVPPIAPFIAGKRPPDEEKEFDCVEGVDVDVILVVEDEAIPETVLEVVMIAPVSYQDISM